jgi:hypothetical protein
MRQLLALLVIASITAGCDNVLSPQRSGALLRTIQIGMSEAEVTEQLGEAQKQEIRGDTKFLYYATSWQIAEKAKERSPVAIRDGKVVGLGIAYQEARVPPKARPWDAWLVEVRPEEDEHTRHHAMLPIGLPND